MAQTYLMPLFIIPTLSIALSQEAHTQIEPKDRLPLKAAGRELTPEPRDRLPLEETGRGLTTEQKQHVFSSLAHQFIEANQSENRGVNWVPAEKNEFPFFVRVFPEYMDGNQLMYGVCGASVISSKMALTAAHCFREQIKRYGSVMPENTHVIFVRFDEITSSYVKEELHVLDVVIHEQYHKGEDGSDVNDIAVISIADQRWTDKVCLESSYIGGNVPVTIVGWGATSEEGKRSKELRKSVNEKTISNEECRASDYSADAIKKGMICATGEGSRGVEDSCQGDSGGPMFHKVDDQWRQVGIVSFGTGCARENYPGVYTRVSEYIDYVKEEAANLNVDDLCIV